MNRIPAVRRLAVTTALAIALFHTACIEFDRQVVSYRVDRQADTLLIFQNYLGIYGADAEHELTEQEIQQLRSVLENERTFFFANWIFELNVSQMDQAIRTLHEEEVGSPGRRELNARLRKAVKTLRDNLTINNGPFYLDAKGHLSGVQMVRITRLSTVVKAVNDGIQANLQRDLLTKDLPPERRHLTERAVADKAPFLEIEGNQIRFRHPMTAEAFRREFTESENVDKNLQRLREAGIVVTHKDGELRAAVGKVGDRVTRVAMDTFEKPYRGNALAHVQKTGIAVEPEYGAARAAREFLGTE